MGDDIDIAQEAEERIQEKQMQDAGGGTEKREQKKPGKPHTTKECTNCNWKGHTACARQYCEKCGAKLRVSKAQWEIQEPQDETQKTPKEPAYLTTISGPETRERSEAIRRDVEIRLILKVKIEVER